MGRPRSVTTEEQQKMIKMFADGKSAGQISKSVGRCLDTVYKALKHQCNLSRPHAYVETGRIMPPVHKSECKIIVDKTLAEQLLSQINIRTQERLTSVDIKVTGRDRHRNRTPGMMAVI